MRARALTTRPDGKGLAGSKLVPKPLVLVSLKPFRYFNDMSGKCEQFSYGGCGGNANNFAERKTCEQRCLNSTLADLMLAP